MESLFLFLFFVALGIGAFVARRSRFAESSSGGIRPNPLARAAGIASPLFFGIAILILVFASFVTIQPGEVGIQVFFGNVQQDILESGFHIINPLISVV